MNNRFTLGELAARLEAHLQGDPAFEVSNVNTLQKAGPHDIAFCTHDRYLNLLRTTEAGAVIVKASHLEYCNSAAIVVADPYYAYAEVATLLRPSEPVVAGVHPTASVAANAVLGSGVQVNENAVIEAGAQVGADSIIGAGVFIGTGATIGAGSRLAPGVHIAHGCTVGARAIMHAGVVIGADGFGFAPGSRGWRKVPQLGAVQIGDDVEIGANSTIDRGALDDTIIESDVKIDNLVHIAHNCRIGANTVIAGCTVIAGSTTIGKNCLIGGQSAVTGHIDVCDGVTIMGMTGVTGSIREPGVYSSPIPAQPVKQWRRNAVRFTQLDDMFRRLKELEKIVES